MWRVFLETGGLRIISSMILFPIYIWIIFSLLRKRFPNLFLRLSIGILLHLLGVISLLAVDSIGHLLSISNFENHNRCVFRV